MIAPDITAAALRAEIARLEAEVPGLQGHERINQYHKIERRQRRLAKIEELKTARANTPITSYADVAKRQTGHCEDCAFRVPNGAIQRGGHVMVCSILGNIVHCNTRACAPFYQLSEQQREASRKSYVRPKKKKPVEEPALPVRILAIPPLPTRCPRCNALLFGRDLTCVTHGDQADYLPIVYTSASESMPSAVIPRRWM
jgi:hypothetical protein